MTTRFMRLAVFGALCFGQAPPPGPTFDVADLAPGLYAMINTSVGTITAQLFEKETPNTVQNFVALSRGTRPWRDPKTRKAVVRPLYSNLIFHRVIPDFMIQTGDPTGVGDHDCGYMLKAEIRPDLKFDQPGRLGMATFGGQPDTGACQFFITEVPNSSLNGQHTIFGQVVDGLGLVGKIARVVRDDKDKPRLPMRLINITFLRIPEKAAPAN
jgi:cyclophilin family peptidyl-prolyl cis-trans isomerase